MKNLPNPQSLVLVILIPFCLFACDGCPDKTNDWLEEHTIVIPKTDDSPPEAWLEITDAKTGETIRADEDLTLTKRNGDQLSIVLWGKDEESGIKKLCVSQGFRKECCSTNLDLRLCSITQPLSGSQCVDMPVIDTQAFISWFMFSEIYVSMPCDSGWELESGSYSLTGTVTNSLDATAHISLVVRVEE